MSVLQPLKGFRDFLPIEQKKRNYVKQKISSVFELHGFEPLETPTLEYAELLAGKYGDEADQLLYRFQDRGEREVALRYDQTVPMARVISQHFKDSNNFLNNEQTFFQIHRRYQIQNVFRAEKPQKGRYREFTQCDCDIFGSLNSIADAEILAVFYDVFHTLGVQDLVIQYNDRQQLYQTFAPYQLVTGQPIDATAQQERIKTFIQSLDKLDKVSKEEVIAELVDSKHFEKNVVNEIFQILESSKQQRTLSPVMTQIIDLAVSLGIPETSLQFNPFLARGLDYYTNLIFEGTVPGLKGSLGGGGRYDHLIEQLGSVSCAAVGFGIGFDRTVEAVEELGLLPAHTNTATARTLVCALPTSIAAATTLTHQLRSQSISVELYTDSNTSLEKQLKYADRKGIPSITILGETELANHTVTIKNLISGEQHTIPTNEVISFFKNFS